LLVIGITGNIACGKSTVDAMLHEITGATIVDADQVTHQVLGDEPTRDRVAAEFGPEILGPGGLIDRARLGRIVFSAPANLRRLEAIVHPAVSRVMRSDLAAVAPGGIAVIDAVKLLDGDLASLADAVWWVTATPEQQLARLMTARGLSESDARSRLAAQPPLDQYRHRVQVIIDNSGSLAETRHHVGQALQALFLASTAAVTAGMKAAFDLQNMALAARLQMVDGANASYQELAKQVSDTTRQAQEATLEAWQAGIRASVKLVMNKDQA
jgi:dephospho-CoA kinase